MIYGYDLQRSGRHSARSRVSLLAFCFFCWALLAHASGPAGDENRDSGRVRVLAGVDVLESQHFAALRGKHIGIVTNHTGLDARGRTTIEVLIHAEGVQVVALFSPEHGLTGTKDEENLASGKDTATGLPVYSLYGETRRPTAEMLKGVDALVFDIQDAGVRFYTYTTTMAYCMEEAAKHNIAFFVLDRPNPLGGEVVEGPMLDPDRTSFTAYFPLPVRYGLTIGELAKLFNEENRIHCELYVVRMKNWRRGNYYGDTGMSWVPPSPNLRTLTGSILYPGLDILQNAGVSVGRGTDTPFEKFGAPWIDGEIVASRLNRSGIRGVHFSSEEFVPASGLYAGQKCEGVSIRVKEERAVRSMSMGMEIARLLKELYPSQFDVSKLLLLLGNAQAVGELQQGVSTEAIVQGWHRKVAEFERVREKYLLYP